MLLYSSTNLAFLICTGLAIIIASTVSAAENTTEPTPAPTPFVVDVGKDCGIAGGDFLNPNFFGQFRVAGPGCTIGIHTDCYCYGGWGQWTWQCNSMAEEINGTEVMPVQFGPIEGKVCPAEIPVPKGPDGELPIEVPCNDTIHPMGHSGDFPCGYSDCDELLPGSTSAVCGCVDRDAEGGAEKHWVCLHSTCDCDAKSDSDGKTDPPTPTPATSASSIFFVGKLSIVAAFAAATVFFT